MRPESKETEAKPVEIQNEDSSPEFEVKNDGPGIASKARNKLLIIIASIILGGAVFYMFFSGESKQVKEEEVQTEEPVIAPEKNQVAPSESGKSPFAFDEIEQPKTSEGVEFLDKPATPDIPTIPELPENDSALKDLILAPVESGRDQAKKDGSTQDNKNPSDSKNSDPDLQKKSDNQISESQKIVEIPPPVAEKKEPEQAPPEPEPIDPRYSPIIAFGGAGQDSKMSSIGYENNIINLKVSDLDRLKPTEERTEINIINDRAHVIAQGKFISAVIESSITTEMPGPIRGIIDRDVYGETGREILLPRGTRVFGNYSASVKRGQGRVEINWTRLLRQDGVSLNITFSGSDQFGRTGVQGDIDNRFSSVIANSLLTSFLAVGGLAAAQGILGDNNSTTTVNPGFGTVTTTGNAANQALYDVTRNVINIVGQVLNNSIDLNPIIRIPQGTRVTLIVTQDLRIPSMKRNPRSR